MHWIIEIDILLKPAEIGKDGLPVPAARTGLLPAFEVAWQPAQRKLRVDARSPAHHPRLMEEGRRPVRFRVWGTIIASSSPSHPVSRDGEMV